MQLTVLFLLVVLHCGGTGERNVTTIQRGGGGGVIQVEAREILLKLALYVLILTVNGADATGILGPGQTMPAPINSTAAFNCTINRLVNSEDVRWYVTLPNTYVRIWPQDADFLRGNGINVTTYNVTAAVQSTLYIVAINRTNGTTVQCALSTNLSVQSLRASLIVYGEKP